MTERTRLAELPLGMLAVLTVGFAAGLAAVQGAGPSPEDAWSACVAVAGTATAKLTRAGLLLPAGLLGAMALAALLALGHQLVATRRLLRRLMRGRVTPSPALAAAAARAGVGGIDVVDDAGVFVFCHGLLRPRVCVSTALTRLLSPAEMAAVLRHEAHHARERDPLKIVLGRTLSSALFFLPVAGALRNGFLAGKEICADLAAHDDAEAWALPSALIKMLSAERPSWPAGVLAIGALSPTEARICSLLEPGTPHRTLPAAPDWLATLALAAGIFGVSLSSAAAAGEPAAHYAHCAPAASPAPGSAPDLVR